jgi:hypothetical protein
MAERLSALVQEVSIGAAAETTRDRTPPGYATAQNVLRDKDSNLEFQGQNLASCRLLHPAIGLGEYSPGTLVEPAGPRRPGARPARPSRRARFRPVDAGRCPAADAAAVE